MDYEDIDVMVKEFADHQIVCAICQEEYKVCQYGAFILRVLVDALSKPDNPEEGN